MALRKCPSRPPPAPRLGCQEFEKHQRQRYVDDQYDQHQLLPREPIL